MSPIPVLVISGTVGAGKTSLADAVSDHLRANDVPHACIDADALTWVYPRPADDPYGSQLMARNLAAVWANARDAGAQRLVLPRVVETRAGYDALLRAIPGAVGTLVRVTAPEAVVRDRLTQRDHGDTQAWSLQRTGELAAILETAALEDLLVENDGRPLAELAAEVVACWDARIAALAE